VLPVSARNTACLFVNNAITQLQFVVEMLDNTSTYQLFEHLGDETMSITHKKEQLIVYHVA
jgi:hypothetical protein